MKNKLYIKIEGMNLSRLIDKLVQKGVCIFDLKTKSNSIKFCIDENDFFKLKDICQKEHKTYQIISKSGIKNLVVSLRYVLGFVLAVIISGSYLLSFRGIVTKLNLTYSSVVPYDLAKVEILLKENGVAEGESLNLTTKEIENLLLLKLDDISGCTVIKKGATLSICLYPEVDNSVVKKELIAKYDAIITELKVFSGESKFKVGDIVKSGDVLISSDSEAKGIVNGKVYFSSSKIYNENQQQIEYTGNFYTNKTIKLFNKILYKQQKNNIFSQYLVKKCDFYTCENLFLPLYCEEEYVFEIKIIEKVVLFSSVETEIKNELITEMEQKAGVQIDKENITFSVVRDGSYVRVDCFGEIELNLI